jgi:hypothetical protein
MAVLFFVGVDKVGKTTLFQKTLKTTNRHICVDRFTACQYVYGKHHNRIDTPLIQYLREVEMGMLDFGGFVFVEANLSDIEKRFAEHNEKDIEIEDITKVMFKYREYMNDTYTLPVLYLNTSFGTIEECTSDIIRFGDWIDMGEEQPYEEIGPGRILLKSH